jgi:hypothetical protein
VQISFLDTCIYRSSLSLVDTSQKKDNSQINFCNLALSLYDFAWIISSTSAAVSDNPKRPFDLYTKAAIYTRSINIPQHHYRITKYEVPMQQA